MGTSSGTIKAALQAQYVGASAPMLEVAVRNVEDLTRAADKPVEHAEIPHREVGVVNPGSFMTVPVDNPAPGIKGRYWAVYRRRDMARMSVWFLEESQTRVWFEALADGTVDGNEPIAPDTLGYHYVWPAFRVPEPIKASGV